MPEKCNILYDNYIYKILVMVMKLHIVDSRILSHYLYEQCISDVCELFKRLVLRLIAVSG